MKQSPQTDIRTARTGASAPVTFGLLLLGEVFSLRLEWFWYLVQTSFVPLTYLLFVRFLWGDPGSAVFAVTGSLVTTVTLSAMLSLGQYVGWLKDSNAYEHYAALPISLRTFVMVIATRGVMLSLPALIVVSVVGYWLLGITLPPLGILVLLLGAYSMAGAGALIGFWSRTANAASLITQVAQTVIIFYAPVYMPTDRLPAILQVTARIIPTSYAAHGLRAAVAGASIAALWPDLAVLLAWTLVSLLLVPLRIKWRQS